MRHRRPIFAFALAIGATWVLAATALAGGWASAIIDAPPQEPIAGEPISIGFTLLQHGRTPVDWGTPTVALRNPETGDEVTVTARRQGPTGHWIAELTVPAAGTWEWQVTHELDIATEGFTPITVAAPAGGAVAGSPITVLLAGIAALALLAGLIAVGLLNRGRRARLAARDRVARPARPAHG